ncbi:MAG: 4-hydroxythreonine-4-phosphate dehydrogenase PdxA [Candidatus Omnitrophota bacterium]
MHDVHDVSVPEIVITMGDPSGIGPEISAKAIKDLLAVEDVVFTVVGDKDVLFKAFTSYCPEAFSQERQRIVFVDADGVSDGALSGSPEDRGALKALRSIEKSIEIISDRESPRKKALVTSPVNKENIARVRKGFVGHTEFLQEAFNSDFVSMAFVGEHLRVVPVTRHVALKDVPGCLTEELVLRTIEQVLMERGIMSDVPDPIVIVTALNPHSGEGGKMGNEEKEIITPAIDAARGIYRQIEGPVPSDVAFYRALKSPGSIVVSMYHDQCLGPFKMLDFDNGVNLTLGLGIVRTSPDHGTAFDIAGKGIARPGSMKHAIKLAIKALRSST